MNPTEITKTLKNFSDEQLATLILKKDNVIRLLGAGWIGLLVIGGVTVGLLYRSIQEMRMTDSYLHAVAANHADVKSQINSMQVSFANGKISPEEIETLQAEIDEIPVPLTSVPANLQQLSTQITTLSENLKNYAGATSEATNALLLTGNLSLKLSSLLKDSGLLSATDINSLHLATIKLDDEVKLLDEGLSEWQSNNPTIQQYFDSSKGEFNTFVSYYSQLQTKLNAFIEVAKTGSAQHMDYGLVQLQSEVTNMQTSLARLASASANISTMKVQLNDQLHDIQLNLLASEKSLDTEIQNQRNALDGNLLWQVSKVFVNADTNAR